MGEIVLKSPDAVINSVDLSDHIRSITITYGAEIQDKTASGDGTRTKLAGLIDWSVAIEFNQDYAADKVDATLFSLVGAAAFSVVFKPASGAVAATNPSFSGDALLESYIPIGGTVGDAHVSPITLQGTDTLTRATS